MKRLLSLFIVFAFTLVGAQAYASLTEQKISDLAPDFSLPGSDGKTHTLSEHKGKIVVLEWTNPECPFVVKHYDTQNMQKLQEKYTAQEVVWYSINSTAAGKEGSVTPEQAAELVKEKGIKATAVLIDSDGATGKAYGAKNTPHMFVIDPEGKFAYIGAIDDNASADKADVEGAHNYVAAALDSLIANKPVEVAVTKPYGCSVKY